MLTPLINEAAVMVTWAVLIPSLTPLLCLAGIVRSWHIQAGLGRMLTMKPRRIPISTIATSCLIPLLTLFFRAMGPMFLVSAVVCSWMLWDTFGDDPGAGAYDSPWWIILAMVVPIIGYAIAGTCFFTYQSPSDSSSPSGGLGLLAASSSLPPRWMTGASRDGMEFASFPSPRHVVTSPISAMATLSSPPPPPPPPPPPAATRVTVDNPLQTAEHRSSAATMYDDNVIDPAAAAAAEEDSEEVEALGATTPADHGLGNIVEL